MNGLRQKRVGTRRKEIAAAFDRAAPSYAQEAKWQQEVSRFVADHLLRYVRHTPLPPSPHVLDVGCGSGQLASLLAPTLAGTWLMSDLSFGMVNECRRRQLGDDYLVMDGEAPCLLPTFDLVLSNLAAQWFTAPSVAIAGIGQLLKPNGCLALSTLSHNSFHEWRAHCATQGVACGIPNYPTLDEIRSWCPQNWRWQTEEIHIPWHALHALDFLRSLKVIGAQVPQPHYHPLPLPTLRTLIRRAPYPFTFSLHVVLILATTPP